MNRFLLFLMLFALPASAQNNSSYYVPGTGEVQLWAFVAFVLSGIITIYLYIKYGQKK